MIDSSEKPPFTAHRRYYLVLKLVVLAAAVLLALHYFASIPMMP